MLWKKPKMNLTWSLIKCQPGPKLHPGGWGYVWPKVNLTEVVKTLGHKMSLLGGSIWTKGQSDPKIWQKCQPDPKPHLWVGDLSDQRSTWKRCLCLGVHMTQRSEKTVNLTQSLTSGGYIWPEVTLTAVVIHLATRCCCWVVHLTKGKPDQEIWQKCQPDLKPHI